MNKEGLKKLNVQDLSDALIAARTELGDQASVQQAFKFLSDRLGLEMSEAEIEAYIAAYIAAHPFEE